jgi:phosphoesterase RecJ-like protein
MSIEKDIYATVAQYDTIIIHRHQRPDPDALGSQVGLATILKAAFPAKQIYCVGEEVPGLMWVAQMDHIADATYQGALVIVTDTANAPRISDDRYANGAKVIKIDHHPNDEPYGDLQLVRPGASSSSELVYDWATANGLTVSAAAARLLYIGIVGDTGRFMYDATTSHTFAVTAALTATDFKPALINQKLDSMSAAQAKLYAYVLGNLTVLPSGAAHVLISAATLKSLGLTVPEASSIVSLPGKLAEVVAWVIFVEQAPDDYRVHFRSKGPIINGLARKHDGGGHPLASGAHAVGTTETETIVHELDALVQNAKAD